MNDDITFSDEPSRASVNRRRFLVAAGAAAGTVVLVGACGQGDNGREIRSGAAAGGTAAPLPCALRG